MKELLKEKLSGQFPNIQFEFIEQFDELTLKFDKSALITVCEFLKKEDGLKFNFCEDITAIDWATRKNRFTVVYHIFSLENKFRLCLKVDVDETECSVETVSSIWKAANWAEREVFDMYGITFVNHPDLRRMYMPEEFEHHPLRKEYPLMGIPGAVPLPKK